MSTPADKLSFRWVPSVRATTEVPTRLVVGDGEGSVVGAIYKVQRERQSAAQFIVHPFLPSERGPDASSNLVFSKEDDAKQALLSDAKDWFNRALAVE